MNSRLGAAAWYLAAALYAAVVCAWLLVGLVVAITAHAPSWHGWAMAASGGRHGSAWISIGRGLIAGAAHSHPTTGVVLDYIYSAANLFIALALLRIARRDRAARLLVLGLIGTAGAFNLQAHTAVQAVAVTTGLRIDSWDTALLHGIGGTAYALALILFPAGSLPWLSKRTAGSRALLISLVLALSAACATLSAQYPHTLTFAVFFGLVIPLGAGAAQRAAFSSSATLEARERSRTMIWALGITCAAAVLLAAIALSTQALRTPGLPRDVPGISTGMPGLTGNLPGLDTVGTQVVAFWIFRGISLVVPCAALVAMARFRLGSVEALFNRALILGGLVAAAGATYVFVVVRADAWFGLDSDWLAPPQVAAAGLVALAVHPLRIRLERWADRLVYGRRVAPYDVLAQVSALSQTSGSTESLVSLARIAAEGLRNGSAIVYLDLEDGTRAAYAWPTDTRPPDDAPRREIPVSYRGIQIGALSIPETSGRRSLAHRGTLLDHLSRAAAVVMHNAALAIELEHKLRVTEQRAAEIRASRWRIVAAQDRERRELERDLHDGAQPALTAVRFSLGLAAHLAAAGDGKAGEALARLRDQIDDASVSLRQTLRGLAPAALGDHGIGRALRDLAESLGTAARFRTDDETSGSRFPAEIEAAVYFCCAEAIQNAAKYCPDASVSAVLRFARAAGDFGTDTDADTGTGELTFAVVDDGPGFDATASTGSGMQNMADRIAAVHGTLSIESALGEGTTVSGKVPAAPLPELSEPSLDEGESAIAASRP